MCGLVGVAGDLSVKDVDVFKQLLYVDYLRGEHSVGVAAIHSNTAEVRIRKATCDPIMFFQLKGVTEVVNSINRVLMGHNRHATRGKVNTVNAHPYHVGRIVGAHNGTLDYSCTRDLANNRDAETDSEQIMATLDELDGDIAGTIAMMEGAWALSVYDTVENTITLVRNTQRPLYYCLAESRKTLYWASEAWMLRGILLRNGIKIKDIIEIAPDQALTWGVPANSTQIFREEPVITPAEGKKRVNFQGGHSTMGGHNNRPWMQWGQGPRESPGNNGGNNSGNASHNVAELSEDEGWALYGEGYCAYTEGKRRVDCPYHWNTNPEKWDKWIEGYSDAEKWEGPVNVKNQPATTGSVVDLEAAKKKAKDKKAKDDSKRSQIYDRRRGPGNKHLNRGEFHELTKSECGWCNNPVVFEDKGQFITTPAHGPLYVCETCVEDGEYSTHIPEAQASA